MAAKSPRGSSSKMAGSSLVSTGIACFALAALGALLPVRGIGAELELLLAPLLGLAGQAWEAAMGVLEALARPLAALRLPGGPTPSAPLRLLGWTSSPAARAVLFGASPLLVGVWLHLRGQAWRSAALRSGLAVFARVRLGPEPAPLRSSAQDLARRFLAAQGIAAGPDSPLPKQRVELTFAEVEAEAAALLRRRQGRRQNTAPLASLPPSVAPR